MLEAIGTGFQSILGWAGEFVNNLVTAPVGDEATLYVLLPILGLSVGYGVIKFGVYIIKRFIPGV